jgi:hypothetical protein
MVLDTERIKDTPIHIRAKSTFAGWPSTESRWIGSFHNFLSYSRYFRKYFKFVYTKKMWLW